MSGKQLEGDWLRWLKENLDRKCDPEPLLDSLLKNHFDIDSIRQHMGLLFPERSSVLTKYGVNTADGKSQDVIDYDAISRPRLTRDDSGINAQRFMTSRLQLYTVDEFLTEEECDQMIAISSAHLRRSTVTTGPKYASYRTSSTSDLSVLNNEFVKSIDNKIALGLGIQLSYSEGIQAQRYEVGQEFKEHTDYFKSATYAQFAGAFGQRTWTFMIYLNSGMTGGGTRFHAINKTFQPRKGMAVVWNNLRSDGTPNPDTLHSGEPVIEGYKMIITKWFRERGVGPQFY